jgi:hypothetical protein
MGKSKEEIEDRIRELDEEWDIDRVFEAKTAGAIIMAAILGSKLNKKWFLMCPELFYHLYSYRYLTSLYLLLAAESTS